MDTVHSESKMVLNSTAKVILCKFFIRMVKSRWCLMLEKESCAKDIGCFPCVCNSRVWDKTIQWNLDLEKRDVNNFVWGKYLLCTGTLFLKLDHQLFRVVLECWAAKPATELPYSREIMRTPEMERILNPAKLEEYHRRGPNWSKNVQRTDFFFVLFFPQSRVTSYTVISSEKALQEEWELFKWKTHAQLLFPWLIMYSYAQKPSCCNISMIFVGFFLSLTVRTSVYKTYVLIWSAYIHL